MKNAFLAGALLLALLLTPGEASADASAQSGLSMGFVLGDPTGFTLRSELDERNALQAHIGFSPFPGDAFSLVVDWTHDTWNLLRDTSSAALLCYLGVGGKAQWFTGRYYAYEVSNKHRFSDESHFGLGVRGVVGLRVAFQNAPYDLFFELAPVGFIFVVPDVGANYDVDFALGARYRF